MNTKNTSINENGAKTWIVRAGQGRTGQGRAGQGIVRAGLRKLKKS